MRNVKEKIPAANRTFSFANLTWLLWIYADVVQSEKSIGKNIVRGNHFHMIKLIGIHQVGFTCKKGNDLFICSDRKLAICRIILYHVSRA